MMLSKTPYRLIVTIFMLMVLHLRAQTIESNCPSYQQNKIEIVLDNSCDIEKIEGTKVIDSLFCCRNSQFHN